jgi:putative ABC transport system ATP-binding protein
LLTAIEAHRSGSSAIDDASQPNTVLGQFDALPDCAKQDVLNFLRSLSSCCRGIASFGLGSCTALCYCSCGPGSQILSPQSRLPRNHSSLTPADPQTSKSRRREKAPTTTDDVVELSGVRFSWRAALSPAVAIDSLRVARGERLLLRGPSGSGKSTLLSLLAGVLKAQSGSVRVLGHELGALGGAVRDRFRADHIGVIFQMFNLIPYLSVQENVCLPCAFSTRRRDRCEQSGASVRQVAARLLDHLDMGGDKMLRRQVTELSVGQQQRVAAARSLIGAPELVLADEPTSSLDADRRAAFLELLFRECARERATLIFVTHDVTLAPLFDRAVEFADLNRVAGSSPVTAISREAR